MAIVTSRTSLNQGAITAASDAVFATGTGSDIKITSVGSELPALSALDFFEIRDHSNAQNNGLYRVVTVSTSTSDYECDKVLGAAPVVASTEAISTLGSTATPKSVFFDTTNNGSTAIIEQGNVSVDGVTGQAIYSFAMQEWKDDDFLIANSPFPMLTIDSDAGKVIIGQDISGNNSGANWIDDAGFSIRTRKLLRNVGWDEVDSNGNTIAREVGIVTLGAFEDIVTDKAYYQFGSDTTVDDTVDFDFAGPVNEAVRFFEEQTQTDLAITATTITRIGGSFITEGYKVGGQVTIRSAEDVGNDGTFVLTTVTATVLTTSGLTANADDTTAILAVNNDNAITLRLRVRDGDTNGKTFAQANLANAGKTILGNFVYSFPLANGTDLKITVADIGIDSNSDGSPNIAPYSGMSITYFGTLQSRTDLVGGSADFGIIIEGNNGTAEEVFEFLQWSLRSTGGFGSGDIDDDADTAIGRAMDGLARFVGDTGEFGSTDGGLSFPTNPDGGGSGVYVDNLNATSKNSVVFYDNAGDSKAFPETIAVTLDFNQIAIDDTSTEYDLFYDSTIITSVTDFVLTSGTDKITSTGNLLPNNSEITVNKYIRIGGLTGADAAMNGVYQITVITTPTSDWTVVRYDGAAIVSVASTTVSLDQNCIDTPDAIIVHTNVVNIESGSTVTYTSPDTISDSANGFGSFASGDIIEIEGSTSNDGVYEVDTAAAGVLTIIEQTLSTEASSTSSVISKAVSGKADADEVFSYDFDGNVQGGRIVSTTTFVKAKAIGSTGAQYVESTIATIASGTPLTIPLAAATERNYA